jgi:hypothetical protein
MLAEVVVAVELILLEVLVQVVLVEAEQDQKVRTFRVLMELLGLAVAVEDLDVMVLLRLILQEQAATVVQVS